MFLVYLKYCTIDAVTQKSKVKLGYIFFYFAVCFSQLLAYLPRVQSKMNIYILRAQNVNKVGVVQLFVKVIVYSNGNYCRYHEDGS